MRKKFDALLLAAGEGRRLRPITASVPKCLVPVCGTPLLDYWIKLLASNDRTNRIFINTSYLAEAVNNFLQSHENKNLVETLYEPKLLGTAGTIIKNSHRFSTKDIFIAHADNLSYFNLNEFHQRHEFRPKYTTVTMMTFETDNPSSCGILSTNSDGVMTKYVEKPNDSFFGDANGATYFFSREAIDEILNLRDAKDISKDVMPTFIGKVLTWKNTCYHRDIGTPESLKKANQEYQFIGKKKV